VIIAWREKGAYGSAFGSVRAHGREDLCPQPVVRRGRDRANGQVVNKAESTQLVAYNYLVFSVSRQDAP